MDEEIRKKDVDYWMLVNITSTKEDYYLIDKESFRRILAEQHKTWFDSSDKKPKRGQQFWRGGIDSKGNIGIRLKPEFCKELLNPFKK
jgi:hypothetical protein